MNDWREVYVSQTPTQTWLKRVRWPRRLPAARDYPHNKPREKRGFRFQRTERLKICARIAAALRTPLTHRIQSALQRLREHVTTQHQRDWGRDSNPACGRAAASLRSGCGDRRPARSFSKPHQSTIGPRERDREREGRVGGKNLR